MTSSSPEARGARVVTAHAAGTVALLAASVMGAAGLRVTAAAIGLVAFVLGTAAFLAGLVVAARRSRFEEVSIGGMLLTGGAAPRRVTIRFYVLLAVQVVATVAAAALRPYTVVAFVVLGPMLGLGLAVWWGARYGRFPPRPPRPGGRPGRPA